MCASGLLSKGVRMQPSDRQAFDDLLADVMAFYREELSRFGAGLWWSACESFDFEQVCKAFDRHAVDTDRGQFVPKPCDIKRQLEGTSTDRAAIAWGKVFDALARVGAYTDVVFDDAAIHAVVEDLGGWPKMFRSDLAELSYLQHRFTESYRAYIGRGKFEYSRRLIGDRCPDDDFLRKGLPVPKPAVIGDVVKAREVYRLGCASGKSSVVYQSIAASGGVPLLRVA